MRIGILTLPLHTNYGGILQAYALQTVLEKMGHEVVVFDTPKSKALEVIGCLFHKFFDLNLMNSFVKGHQNLVNAIIARNIGSFIRRNIHVRNVGSFNSLHNEDFDAIVVGSDQIWRSIYFPRWMNQPLENAFLSFSKGWDIKRISYAASFGTENWEYTDDQTSKCREYIKKFDAISVREKSGVELCKRYFDVKAIQVLDPTMLLDSKDYSFLFRKGKIKKSNGNLLCYVLDETNELIKLKKQLAKYMNLQPFDVNNSYENDASLKLNSRTKPSVESWLRGFYDAEFVITDSFHACVFSIIFRKQFIVFGNRNRGMSRFESLLAMFGLEKRLVDEDLDLSNLEKIDYDSVYQKYNILKEQSYSFLEKYLK